MKAIKNRILFFMIALVISGITAIPVQWELRWLADHFPFDGSIRNKFTELWLATSDTGKRYPNLLYGYDWLAFAHFILALLFIGPLRDPVKNIWVIEFGIIACVLVLPFAFIAGHFRGIPVWWRMIDCSFGVIGFILLVKVWALIRNLPEPEQIIKTEV